MSKKLIFIGLAGLGLAVSLGYEFFIYTSQSTDTDPKTVPTVNENESLNAIKFAQTKDPGITVPIDSKAESVTFSINDQIEAKKEDEKPAHQQHRQITPMPVHVEGHTPVDLDEFLEARENRRLRFAENYDNILNENPVNLERQENLALQAEQALAQIESLSGVTLDGVTCSDTLCRMTLAANNEDSHLELRKMAAGIGVLLSSDAWTYSDPDQGVSYVYTSLPGGKLPNI